MPVIVMPGFEADDIIGTLAKSAKQQGLQVYMVTGDKDFMQLLEDDIYMYKPASGSKPVEIVGTAQVIEKWGVEPQQITDYLGLVGDNSDNIPGVKGIGPAKAAPLLQEWRSVEGILKHLEQIENARIVGLLREGAESAKFSKQLATIQTDVPVEISIADLKTGAPDEEALNGLFTELEFHSLLTTREQVAEEEKPAKDYRTLSTPAEIKKMLKSIKPGTLLSVDLETTSIDPMKAEIVGVSLSTKPNAGVYIPIRSPQDQQDMFHKKAADGLLAELKSVLEDPSIPKCGQNLKYDILILRRNGIELGGLDFDTMIAAFLIQPDARSYKLDKLSQHYLHYNMQPIEELIGSGTKQITMDQVAVDKVTFYAAEDADVALQLVPLFTDQLKSDQTWDVYRKIEMPLIPVLIQMEQNGVYLDCEFLKMMSQDLTVQIDEMVNKIYAVAGLEFNINSPKQLGDILFDKMQLPSGRKRSTAVDVLERLKARHPLPGMILDYRALAKLQNTYVEALPQLVNPDTGRVHSSFNQTVASTGRLSSSDPNFQNIPIRTEIGREIRKAFIPQDSTWKLISADYSQIELRIMAHLSGDPELVRAFHDGVDIHARTAALVYGVDEKDVIPDMRRVAKVVNFGIMYGAGPYRMSNELGIPMGDARKIIDQYFKTYPGINNYIITTLEGARRDGYVKTLSGRLRYVPDINSANRNIREAAERAAINMPIQGTAADMIKIAMIRIHDQLLRHQLQAKLILQIHDELLFEAPDREVQSLIAIIRDEMESAMSLDIPLKVDVGTGNSWYEAH